MRLYLIGLALTLGCSSERSVRDDEGALEGEACVERVFDECIEAGGSDEDCELRALACFEDEEDEEDLFVACDVRCGGLAQGVTLGCVQAGGDEAFCRGEAAIAYEYCQYGCGTCLAEEEPERERDEGDEQDDEEEREREE